ncbi:MAG: HU family DNA-binding protein [Clostridium sp.]|nr:HU family DNA-binding protein [Clostridium sp.]
MDSKTFISQVAKLMNADPKEAGRLTAAFAQVLRERASGLDSIAMPGFGNFVATKKPERVKTDKATGRKMLLPPQLLVEFVPSSALKKLIANE